MCGEFIGDVAQLNNQKELWGAMHRNMFLMRRITIF
jgi:hypothetical protein